MTDYKNSLKVARTPSSLNKRRTTSSIVTAFDGATNKNMDSVSSSFVYYDLKIEKIKEEIQDRMAEQKKREEFLNGILKDDNQVFNEDMLTESCRKVESAEERGEIRVQSSEDSVPAENFRFFTVLKRICCKCLN